MDRPLLKKFAVIDITKEIKEENINAFHLTNKYDCDLHIYTKTPKEGYLTYADEVMTAILNKEQRHDFIWIRMITKENTVYIEQKGKKGKVHVFPNRKYAIEFFNRFMKIYLTPNAYHCTERNSEMVVHKNIIENMRNFFCGEDAKPLPLFQDYFSTPKNHYFCFIDEQKHLILK